MGNQESISNDAYIIKKIPKQNSSKNISSKNNIQKISSKDNNKILNKNKLNKISNDKHLNNKNIISKIDIYDNNHNSNLNNHNNNLNNHNNNLNNYNSNLNNYNSNDNSNDNTNFNNYTDNPNNILMERSIFKDSNKNNVNRVFSYPSNSNNELSSPKINIDNIEFTPYNFNEEVNKLNKNINDEKIDFEKKEQQRRLLFEKEHDSKRKYLNKQIKDFETKYNPWEILELNYEDYNINNIKKAYKRKALKYHPDKSGDKEKFQLITQAYVYLLNKSEDNNMLDIKINKKVEKEDYKDNINDNVENIYMDKDKFDLNQFNKIFDEFKIPSSFDKGYSDLMKADISKEDDCIFGEKFNNSIFNAHFDNKKKNKNINLDLIEYSEPNALDSSISNLNRTFLGEDNIDDFGSLNSNSLSYTDYKKAHIDENLLIDVNKVKYKTYKNIDQLEVDRANISYVPSIEDKRRYELLDQKRLEDEKLREHKQRNYDNLIKEQYTKLNKKLIINK